MSIDPEITFTGTMLEGFAEPVLKHLVYFPYLDDSKGKMEECAVGEPLITQIFSVRFFIFSLAIISNLITFPGQLFALTSPFSVL